MHPAVAVGQTAGQHHVAAALRIERHSSVCGRPQSAKEQLVRGNHSREFFREAAADIEAARFRRNAFTAERAEVNQLSTFTCEQLQIICVVEVERRVPGYGNDRGRPAGPACVLCIIGTAGLH